MSEGECLRFPLSAYPGMNPFVRDWLDGRGKATQLLKRVDSWQLAVDRRKSTPSTINRQPSAALVSALDQSNRRWGSFVSDELRRWAAGQTVTLIAGQQVGFAGGPLYTLAKIATLIRMKRDLAANGTDATIFFWLATEDHDYAEAATVSLPVSSISQAKSGVNRQLDLLTLRATRAVESRAMVGPVAIPDALIAQLLSLYDMDRPAWLREGITFRDSFAELLANVFDGERIVFVDALLPELRRAGAPLFERMFNLWPVLQQEIASRSDAIERAEYTPQIVTRPGEEYTLLFQIDEHGERHIINKPGADAENISTSALTRPLLQDFVFQPDVFVGGPAEVAYYAQIAPLHDLLGIPMPRVALRGHALVAPKRVTRLFERFAIEPEEVFSNADAILAERESPAVAEIEKIAERARTMLAAEITRIGELALPAEHALARAINRSIGHIEYHFDKLTERAIRGLVRKDRERYAAVRELVATLHPDGHVQDRIVGWFASWHQMGSELRERMVECIEPDAGRFSIVSL